MFGKIDFGILLRYLTTISSVILAFGLSDKAEAACSSSTVSECEYSSDLNFPTIKEFRVTLTDPARANYKLPIMIQYPVGAEGLRPVIIYNHGGGASANGRNLSPEWGEVWAHAGYVVIHPSRAPILNPTAAQRRECKANGVLFMNCDDFFGHVIYGPKNTDFLVSKFAQIGKLHPPLAGLLDAEKVVVAGWSGGSTVALVNAGAFRQFKPGGTKYVEPSSIPIGFLAFAPMGPDYAGYDGGFQTTSYDTIDSRPFLSVTGKGDLTGQPSEPRVTAWLRSNPGNKFLSYDTDLIASHETMNLSGNGCTPVPRAKHCRWIKSVGLAYLDAIARSRPEAIDWMASDNYETLTSGVIELHRR